MTIDPNLPSSSSEEIFTRALERLEAGEQLEAIIAAYPAELHTELRDLLTVVAATHALQTAEIPRPAPSRRAANKRAFLQAAAAMRAEVAAEAPAPAVLPAVVPSVRATAITQPAPTAPQAKPVAASPTWLDHWRMRWNELWHNLTLTPMQFAPMAVILAVVSLATFSFSSVAQAAIPGDLAYPAKQWLRQQELSLAAPEDQPAIVHKIEAETAADVAKAIEKATQQQAPVLAEQTLFFRGWEEGNLRIGSLLVKPKYQANFPEPALTDMTMSATPVEGKMVQVLYQIVPDANGVVAEDSKVVQGISLTVLEDSPTVATVTPVPCQVAAPPGWSPLTIRTGDTVSAIAQRTGTDPVTLTRVNCLENPSQIPVGGTLLVPVQPTPLPSPTSLPSLEATLTAVSTTVSTEVITPTGTVEPAATATLSSTVGLTPTVSMTPATTLTPTVVGPVTTLTPAVTITSTALPTITLTPAPTTPEPTAALSLTLTAIAVTPEATTIVTATITPEPSPTAAPPETTADPPADRTLTPEESATNSDAATPTPLVTPAATATTEVDSSNSDDGNADTPEATPIVADPTATMAQPPTTAPPTTAPVATEVPPTAAATGASTGRSGGGDERAMTTTPTPINGSPIETGG